MKSPTSSRSCSASGATQRRDRARASGGDSSGDRTARRRSAVRSRYPHASWARVALAWLLLATALLDPTPGLARERSARVRWISGLPLIVVPAGRYRPLFPLDSKGRRDRGPRVLADDAAGDERRVSRSSPPIARIGEMVLPGVSRTSGYLSHWVGPTSSAAPRARATGHARELVCRKGLLRESRPAPAERSRVGTGRGGFRNPLATPGLSHAFAPGCWETPGTQPRMPGLPDVPSGPANAYGASDLHGVVWEWVLELPGPTHRCSPRPNATASAAAERSPQRQHGLRGVHALCVPQLARGRVHDREPRISLCRRCRL